MIKSILRSIAFIFFCTLVTNPFSSLAAGKSTVPGKDEGKQVAKRAISYSSRNNHAVKIFPDPLKRIMHVLAKENEGRPIDFFVFDLEGTLVHHFRMQAGDHERLAGLERKKYVYQVFSGDEETAIGQFEIR